MPSSQADNAPPVGNRTVQLLNHAASIARISSAPAFPLLFQQNSKRRAVLSTLSDSLRSLVSATTIGGAEGCNTRQEWGRSK